MKKDNYKNQILFIVISTFVVVCVWVGSDIYNRSIISTLDETLKIQIVPIANTFDLKTIEKIKKRLKIDPLYSASNQSSASSEADLNSSPTPTASVPSSDLEASPGGAVGL